MNGAGVGRDSEVTALFDRCYTPMCRLAFVILGDVHRAEEVVMEAMLKTFTGWGRMRDVGSSESYLRRAVVNGCRSAIRRKAIEARVNALAYRRSERTEAWDPDRVDSSRAVWDAVRTLPERQRACIVLRYLEDLSEAEIASVLECSVGTVKSQTSKARAKLERLLGAEALGGGA